MRKIKIKYLDFSEEFIKNSYITKSLEKKYDIEFSDSPDYIISGCWGKEYLDYDCIRIFYTGENLCPDFNLFDYAISYNYIDYDDRYFRAPIWLIYPEYKKIVSGAIDKHKNVQNNFADRDFCAAVISRYGRYVSQERDFWINQINSYKQVSMGGKYRNNVGGPVEDKLEFQKQYKFACAFENVSQSGYLTEKIVDAFAACTVPIYWGDPNVDRIFNPKAFIDIGKFDSVSKVMRKIEEIDSNDDLYMSMLNEKSLICEKYVENRLRDLEGFLYNIFEQDYKKAFRRDRVGYGLIHNNQLREYRKMDSCGVIKNFSKKYVFDVNDDYFRLSF